MARRATLRASDADREQIAERLRQAAADGRLLAQELEERLATALRARTYGELDALVTDIPGTVERRRGTSMRPWIVPAIGLAIAIPVALAALAVIAFVVTGVLAMWGLWLFLGWWMFGRRSGFEGHGRPPYAARGRRYVHGCHTGRRQMYRSQRPPEPRPDGWV